MIEFVAPPNPALAGRLANPLAMRASVNGGEGSGFGRHHIRRIAGPATIQFPAALDLASMLRPAAARGVDRRGVFLFPAACGFPRSIPSESLQRTSRLDRIACGRRAFIRSKIAQNGGGEFADLTPSALSLALFHGRNHEWSRMQCPTNLVQDRRK